MAAITPERIARMKALCETATPGPWQHDLKHFGSGYIFGPDCAMVADRCENCEGIRIRGTGARLPQRENAEFIAESRTFLPDLLAAYAAATQWRDMASAPKVQYGPLFLAWLDTERYALVRWREDKQRWWEDDMGAVTPTHFLPLPAPPVKETTA